MLNNIKTLSVFELILKGYLWVNIPTTIIILCLWIGLWSLFDVNYLISVFLGTLAGWYYWAFSIKKWIKCAFENNVKEEKILKIGRISLLLWNKSTLEKALSNDSK